jgi:uncharacterized protein YcaQ
MRRFTVARNFPKPTTLKRALRRIGFVQADPIRSPARAQDLILRHRVTDYRAGDLERRYTRLEVEEDFFINYGFVTKSLQALMHPRPDRRVPSDDISAPLPPSLERQAHLLLEFVRERGAVHPREVDAHFAHGTVTNYWGGASNATTHLLDALHYRGMLRVRHRVNGIRIYSPQEHGLEPVDISERNRRIDELINVAVGIYAPVHGSSLAPLVRRLRYAAPQWQSELTNALKRARERLACVRIDGIDWYWPADENPRRHRAGDSVRILAPFDPLVHDRARFELLWSWVYRFEAYTPAAQRKRGYYAMPLLWRDQVIGWANLSIKGGELNSEFGYVASRPPRDAAFRIELEAELDRMRTFLGLNSSGFA